MTAISTSSSRAGTCRFRCRGRYFDPEIAARSYEQHLAVWEEMDRLGYDGVGLNEHHTTPHGLMNSPNMMAAVGAQRTKKLKFFILGNLLPLHNPLRIAEELSMADNISRGRIMAGFARGVPREYKVYDVPMAESRARFDEALAVILKAWTGRRVQPPGQILEVQGHRDLAAPVSAAASAGVDSVHRLEGDDRVRGRRAISAPRSTIRIAAWCNDMIAYFGRKLARTATASVRTRSA